METIQTRAHDDGKSRIHDVILCVAQTVCPSCLDVQNSRHTCAECGPREHIFTGCDPVAQLFDYLCTLNSCKEIYVIEHNAKGFDGQWLLKHAIESKHWAPTVILQGTKILTMQYENLKFLDSISFIPIALAKFNQTFGLKDLVKGYFPHLLCNVTKHVIIPGQLDETNFTLDRQMPAVECYAPDRFFPGERDKFMEWYRHRVESGAGFNFKEELIAYCCNDVYILRLGCLQFREQFINVGDTYPFRECITIASSVNLMFRRQFLKPDTIGLMPSGGYRAVDNQSYVAFEWLSWQAHQRNIIINHAENGRERKVLNMKVDGLCGKTVFEFYGCWWHGCPLCVIKDRSRALIINPAETLESRYTSTLAKRARILNAGYQLIEIWEHDFIREKQTNPELKGFLASLPPSNSAPLNVRNAFFGGRTSAIKLYHKAAPDETLHYFDVCSLYPYVNKYCPYPVGHPTILLDNFPAIDQICGLIKCTVLPPQDLYFPVLPYRSNGKLLFPLCRTCADDRSQEPCKHTIQERAITGEWVSYEVSKAVDMGYKILKTFEVWMYKSVQYDPKTASGGLFASYINTFLKIKQESSGWPQECVDDESKAKYIPEYKEKKGVTLDPAAIEVNPGRRVIAKLCLNSFWGKLGQRSDQPKCEIINDPHKFFSLLTDPNVEVQSVMPVGDVCMVVKYKNFRDIDISLPNTTVIHAAMTTAHARLKLYKYLEFLGRRICYMDTDSVIFTTKPGESNPELGVFLGDLTDEVAPYGLGAKMTEFASGGPKNYGYVVEVNGKQHVTMKVKGFRLDCATGAVVNLNVLKEMLGVTSSEEEQVSNVLVHNPNRILRLRDHTVVSRAETKRYQVVYDKRRRMSNFDTVPFGFLST